MSRRILFPSLMFIVAFAATCSCWFYCFCRKWSDSNEEQLVRARRRHYYSFDFISFLFSFHSSSILHFVSNRIFPFSSPLYERTHALHDVHLTSNVCVRRSVKKRILSFVQNGRELLCRLSLWCARNGLIELKCIEAQSANRILQRYLN